MKPNKPDDVIVGELIDLIASGRMTEADLEFLVMGHAIIGRLCAEAQGISETASSTKKFRWSNEFAIAKGAGSTDKMAGVNADLATQDLGIREIEARKNLAHLKNAKDSIEQAINAVKFLSRNG
jgi:hypothetical protein